MHLDDADITRTHSSLPEHAAIERGLSLLAGICDGPGAGVAVAGRSGHDDEDIVLGPDRVGQALQHDDSNTLATTVTVGGVRVGFAGTCGREEAALAQTGKPLGRVQQRAATDDGRVAFSRCKGLAGQAEGRRARRAARVDAKEATGPLEVMAYAPGREAAVDSR